MDNVDKVLTLLEKIGEGPCKCNDRIGYSQVLCLSCEADVAYGNIMDSNAENNKLKA